MVDGDGEVGATFAYFSVTNGSGSDTTNITATTPEVGVVSISSENQSTSMTLTLDQMKQLNESKKYYANVGNQVSEDETPLTYATIQSTGGSTSTNYTCTANLKVTVGGEMATNLTSGDAAIKFTLDEGITGSTITNGGEISLDTYKSEPLTDTLNFKLKGNTPVTIKGSMYIQNDKSREQNDLAGKQLTVQVVVDTLKCTADDAE